MHISNQMARTARVAVNGHASWGTILKQNPYPDGEKRTAWRKIAFVMWNMRCNFPDTKADLYWRKRVNG